MRSLLPGDGLGLTSLDHRDHPVHLDCGDDFGQGDALHLPDNGR